MADEDDIEVPERGYNTKDVNAQAEPAPRRGRRWKIIVPFFLVLVPALLFVLWASITLTYTYSSGDRAGYIQKFSRKGWLCKTWEGELAMATIPGAVPEIFRFTVRDDRVARELEQAMGQRVTLHYAEHRGVPTSCFGETDYFVVDVRAVAP